jgi:asparagine synthase (glutamine-hydrolysing)
VQEQDFPWTIGWAPAERDRGPEKVPEHGAPADGLPNIWLFGYERDEVRCRRSPDGRSSVLVIGSCLATDDELDRALPLATGGRWRSLVGAGSYLTVLSTGGETMVIGDLAGTVRVSFMTVDGGVLWSTAASAPADYAGRPPDLDRLVLDMTIDGIAPYGGSTPFDGVEVVPPGYALRLVRGRWSIERWYEPLPPTTFAQAAIGIGDALVDGVARRAALSSPITGDSGGTDSTILLALAAQQTDAIGFTYLEDDKAGGDLRHGKRVEAALPRLRREVLRRDPAADHFQGLDHPDELLVPDLPTTFLVSQAHESRILRAAGAAGSSHHLFGIGGDEALTSGPETLPARLRSGRVVSATRGAMALARSDRASTAQAIVAVLGAAAGSYERALRTAGRAIRRHEVDPEAQPTNWQLVRPAQPTMAAGWLTRQAAQRIGEHAQRLAEQRQPWENPEVARDMRHLWRTSLNLDGFRALARRDGLTAHSPWTDHGVLVWSHALASYGREPNGEFKALARHGLRGAVPSVVTERRSKDRLGFSVASEEGRRAAADAIRRQVASSQLIAEGIFDGEAVWASVERWLAGPLRADQPILMLLAAELWLKQRRRFGWKETQ